MLSEDFKNKNDQFTFFTQGLTFVLRRDFNNDGVVRMWFFRKISCRWQERKKVLSRLLVFPQTNLLREIFWKFLMKEFFFWPNLSL